MNGFVWHPVRRAFCLSQLRVHAQVQKFLSFLSEKVELGSNLAKFSQKAVFALIHCSPNLPRTCVSAQND